MSLVESKLIVEIFDKLNLSDINYILIRNIDNELPNNLKVDKDIDILVKNEDIDKIYSFFKKNKFNRMPHPHRGGVFLYGVKKFEFFKNNYNILFDLNYHLVCRSLDKGQWMPLDQIIQRSAWINKRLVKTKELSYWTLSYEDEFITLIVRSIFDKKEFQQGYIFRIESLYLLIDKKDVTQKMSYIFFNYTPTLLKQVEKKEYSDIINNYISFKGY
jgi:hypothetical protein